MLFGPEHAIRHVVPQYKRVIDFVHRAGKPFLWHSCGGIFYVPVDSFLAMMEAAKKIRMDEAGL